MLGKIMMQGLHTSFHKIFYQDTPIKMKPCYTSSHYTCQNVTPAEDVKINMAWAYLNLQQIKGGLMAELLPLT